MAEGESIEPPDLPAGAFSGWLRGVRLALRDEGDSDVPCGGCTACCRSSQFVPVGPDETDTLAHIPRALLFPAPRRPAGHLLLGYDEHGRCPLLTDEGCSIYNHRPRACRSYDCRVFPAAGVEVDDKPLVARRARRWRFDHPDAIDRNEHDAVRAAAKFIEDHEDLLPPGSPTSPTQRAVLAVEVHEAFLRHDPGTGHREVVTPEPEAVRVVLTRQVRERARASRPPEGGGRRR